MSTPSTSGTSDFKLDNTRDRNDIRKQRSEPRHMTGKEPLAPAGEYYCPDCHAVYYNKAWHNDERRFKILSKNTDLARTCPACRKTALELPEGIVTLSGLDNLSQERVKELFDLVRNVGDRARKRDPLDRIIKFSNKGSEAVVYTSENQLAESIGKEIRRAFGGDLNVDFSRRAHDRSIARVVWIAKKS